MIKKVRSIAAILVVGPTLVLAQSPPPGFPPAPIGHLQPNAGDVPPGDSIVGGIAPDAPGAPTQITPQERRYKAIDRSLCATTTC